MKSNHLVNSDLKLALSPVFKKTYSYIFVFKNVFNLFFNS